MRKKITTMLTMIMALAITACSNAVSTNEPIPTEAATIVSQTESCAGEEAETVAAETLPPVTVEAPMPDSFQGQFIFANSDTEYITDTDLEGMSAEDLRIARNEIFARHGRRFKDQKLQEYFDSCGWYRGTVDGAEFDKKTDSLLSTVEKENIKKIQHAEELLKNEGTSGSDNGWKETWDLVCSYKMIEMNEPNTSELLFEYDLTNLWDCGSYYELPVTIARVATLDHEIAAGETMNLVINELTHETITLTGMSNGRIQGSNGMEYECLEDGFGHERVLFWADASEDMEYIFFARGTLRIRKKAKIGYFWEPETIENVSKNGSRFANGVTFDNEGYVTAMLEYGD